jgi:hypothetical protein
MTTKQATRRMRLDGVQTGRSFRLNFNPVPLTTFTFTCQVSPSGQGSTVSQSLSMSGLLAPLFSAMMARSIADGFPALLSGLARMAESSASQG